MILEYINNLLEEIITESTEGVIRNGKYVKISKRQLHGKKAGMRWDRKQGRYVRQTGTQKRTQQMAKRKRARTMMKGQAERKRKAAIRKRQNDRMRRSKRMAKKRNER